MNRPTIWVADSPERLPFVQRLVDKLDYAWITDRRGDRNEPPPATDLILVSDERYFSWLPERIVAWREQGIPVLHVADGICEWRNIFDNPIYQIGDSPGAPLYQPIFADKIACLGRCQARILESLGNAGKTEVVGLPRLDEMVPLAPRLDPTPAVRKVCVTSARNPAFTPAQKRQFLQAILDLKKWFDQVGRTLPMPIVPVWRLPEEYAAKLQLPNTSSDMSGATILDTLRECDAFISTPSTVVLEAMLLGLPCAIIDCYQAPLYLDAAWRISHVEHLPALLEMMTPPASKLLFQRHVLHDNLECQTPALPRLLRLIEAMIEIGRDARARGTRPVYPHRILPLDPDAPTQAEDRPSLAELFPQIAALQESDLAALQARLVHAERLATDRRYRCEELEAALARMIAQFGPHPVQAAPRPSA